MPSNVILVVEDNEELRQTLEEILQAGGLETAGAGDGLQALQYLRTAPTPALILLDVMMPVMNGNEFREEQLKDPRLAVIPTIILSALDAEQQQQQVPNATGYLRKPVQFDDLLTLARQFAPRRG